MKRQTIIIRCAVLVAVVVPLAGAPDAEAARRARKPADLTDVTVFTATDIVNQGGIRPTPQNVANTARGLLEVQQRALRTAVDNKQISTQKYYQQNKEVQTALSRVDARAQELTRQRRPTVIERLARVAELPFKAAAEVRRFLERPLPDEVKPFARFFLGQYLGRKFDSLTQQLVQRHGSGGDVAKFVDAWNKIAPYKDNPELAGIQLRDRLKELSRGELGKVFDRLVQSGLKRIGDNPAAREVFVSRMEVARQALERDLGDKIDQLHEKNKDELDKAVKDLTRPMPNKEFRDKLARMPKRLRRWIAETVAEAPLLDERAGTTQGAVGVKAVFVASPDEGAAPLEVSFYGGDSLGEIGDYAWAFGDGGTAGGESSSHVYDKEGKFAVVLTVKGKDGKEDSTGRTIQVKSKPEPKLVVGSVSAEPAEVEPGGSVTLTAEVSVSDCEQQGQVNYTFSTPGVGKSQGGTRAKLVDNVECTGKVTIPKNAKPGSREVLFDVAIVVDAPPEAGAKAAPKGRPVGMVGKGQGSFTIVAKKGAETPAERPIDAWAGTWYGQAGKTTWVMEVRVIDENSIRVVLSGLYQKSEHIFQVSGTTAVARGTEQAVLPDWIPQGDPPKYRDLTWRIDYTLTLILSAEGRTLTLKLENKSTCITDPRRRMGVVTDSLDFVRKGGSTPSPKAGRSSGPPRK